jgi:aspartate kinase
LSESFPGASMSLHKVSLVSAIGRNLRDPMVLARAITVLSEAGIAVLGIHDLMRKVDLQIVVEEQDFDTAVIALHRGLIETTLTTPLGGADMLHAAA